MGIERISEIAELSIESGKSACLGDQAGDGFLDGDQVVYQPGTVAGDIGMFFDGEADVPEGRRVFALTDPVCLNPEARYGMFHDVYRTNRHEVLDARMDPPVVDFQDGSVPKQTLGYDIEISDGNGGKRVIVVTLADKVRNYRSAVEGPRPGLVYTGASAGQGFSPDAGF